MAEQIAQRAPGTTSVSEQVERDWLKFETADQFNEAYTEAVAQSMLNAWRAVKEPREADVLRAAAAKEFTFRNNFAKFWKARGMDVDNAATETAWKKVLAKATERYTKYRMQASAPPLPKPVPQEEEEVIDVEPILEAEPPAVERPTMGAERPLGVMDAAQWLKYDDVVYSPEKFAQFVSEFVPALAESLQAMSSDTSVRTYQMENVHNLFKDKLFKIYLNKYPNVPADAMAATRQNVESWLEGKWKEVLAAAKRYTLPK